jgi:4-hydroxy-4-methyl-2-oxoglutarate aldolase
MTNEQITDAFAQLATPAVADACLRLRTPVRLAPHTIRCLLPQTKLAGRVCPARHYGSVDIFLEAMGGARSGDVLVADNGGRWDESCIGDLIALEAKVCGLAGILIWGAHRDTADLLRIGLPVLSCGAYAAGPQRLDPRHPDALTSAQIGDWVVGSRDCVFADSDGVLFVAAELVEETLRTARSIWETERRQAEAMQAGTSLRRQLRFDEYLQGRAADSTLSLREHLRRMGGAVEV